MYKIKQIINLQKLDIDFNLSNDFLIQEFKDKANWYQISESLKLSENFIRKFQDEVHWSHISVYQKLSENFIREFQDKVEWRLIGKFQKLSEDFITEFQDKVNWYYISKYQYLSEEFILKYWNKLDDDYVIHFQESLTPAFLCWLYRTYQEEEYYLLKIKNVEFFEYGEKIEAEVKIVLIEFS